MLLETAERNRRTISPTLEPRSKSQLGQFMTPATTARFMAGMFPPSNLSLCRLLDAGAGLGALTCAFLDRWKDGGFGFAQAHIDAHELDDTLREHLKATLASYGSSSRIHATVWPGDFVVHTALALLEGRAPQGYTHAILDPPYKKIGGAGLHRQALSQVGIETVNLYSAFVALAIELMAPGGLVVAIVPRSFCNGAYYKPFREQLLTALCRFVWNATVTVWPRGSHPSPRPSRQREGGESPSAVRVASQKCFG